MEGGLSRDSWCEMVNRSLTRKAFKEILRGEEKMASEYNCDFLDIPRNKVLSG